MVGRGRARVTVVMRRPAPQTRQAMTGPHWFADVGLVAELTDQGWQYVMPGLEAERRIDVGKIKSRSLEQA